MMDAAIIMATVVERINRVGVCGSCRQKKRASSRHDVDSARNSNLSDNVHMEEPWLLKAMGRTCKHGKREHQEKT